jgi:hypothetical protein
MPHANVLLQTRLWVFRLHAACKRIVQPQHRYVTYRSAASIVAGHCWNSAENGEWGGSLAVCLAAGRQQAAADSAPAWEMVEPEPLVVEEGRQQQQLRERRHTQHGGAIPRAEFPCRFFPHGRCLKGSDCPYLHDPAVLVAAGEQSEAAREGGRVRLQQQRQPDPPLVYSGPPGLSRVLGEALLCQWRGCGQHRAHTHGFHPRKAVMNPAAVAQLLRLLPDGGGGGRGGEGGAGAATPTSTAAVLDPFVGSGTTCLETMLAGRPALGWDLSPLAVGIARCHCWRPSAAQLRQLQDCVASVVSCLAAADEEQCRRGSGSPETPRTEAAVAADSVDDGQPTGAAPGDIDWRSAHRVVHEVLRGRRAQVDGQVAAALWFLLSHEERTQWPEWRPTRTL